MRTRIWGGRKRTINKIISLLHLIIVSALLVEKQLSSFATFILLIKTILRKINFIIFIFVIFLVFSNFTIFLYANIQFFLLFIIFDISVVYIILLCINRAKPGNSNSVTHEIQRDRNENGSVSGSYHRHVSQYKQLSTL